MTCTTRQSIEAFKDEIEEIRDQRRSWLTLDYHISGDVFVIDLISVEHPQQGLGTEIMNYIIEHADDHGVAIELEASWHGGRNIRQKKLEAWYRRFGFASTGTVTPSGNPMMRREPGSPRA